MKKLSYLAVMLSLTIVYTGLSFAGNHKNNLKVYKIMISERYHHIGDNNSLAGFIVDENEGLRWESSFRIKRSILDTKDTAYVKFLCHDIQGSVLVVNGYRISLDPSIQMPLQPLINYAVPLELDILHSGLNTIGFEVNELGGGNYDDIEFGELEIWFQ